MSVKLHYCIGSENQDSPKFKDTISFGSGGLWRWKQFEAEQPKYDTLRGIGESLGSG